MQKLLRRRGRLPEEGDRNSKAMLLRPHSPTLPVAAKRIALPAAQVKSGGRVMKREGAEYARMGRQPHGGGRWTHAVGRRQRWVRGCPGEGCPRGGGYVVLRGRP